MNRYQRLRYEKGVTIAEISRVSGVSRPTLSRLEDEDREPTAPVAKALADYYGLTIQQLLGVDEPNGAAL